MLSVFRISIQSDLIFQEINEDPDPKGEGILEITGLNSQLTGT